MANIRIIGDEVLHRVIPEIDFSHSADVEALDEIIEVMERNLYETGGLAIAVNQCAEITNPKQVIIVGTNDPLAREKAKERYPDLTIPNETVMVNPRIIKNSGNANFLKLGEGCLSLKSFLRAKVKRYSQTELEYFDCQGNRHQQVFNGFIAHIIQHECDHLHGIVYLQKIINELNIKQRNTLLELLELALHEENSEKAEFTRAPVLIFDRKDREIVFERALLMQDLMKIDKAVLQGIKLIMEETL